MTPNFEAYAKLFEFMGALSVVSAAMAWWRKGSADEDEMVSEAADTVLSALSDADSTRTVECRAGHNWRDDVSIEEAIEMNDERALRRFARRN